LKEGGRVMKKSGGERWKKNTRTWALKRFNTAWAELNVDAAEFLRARMENYPAIHGCVGCIDIY